MASGTIPAASAAPEPPEEPPALIARFQGLRVCPNTGLKVCAPAHSGTLDFPIAIAPLSCKRLTVASDSVAMFLAKSGDPYVV